MVARKARISLCMIVRNEEHNLAECLSPVAELFDEIIIVDTGSRDRTKEVALRFTPHVHDFPWCDDFSAARNKSLRHATGDWVFWLDADDRFSADNISKLGECLGQLNGHPRAYLMNTACSSQYESEGVNLITHIRLFRRHPKLNWKGRVHEQLLPDIYSLGYELSWSDVRVEHIGYRDPVIRQRKLRRDMRLLQMDYAADPNQESTLLHFGLANFHLGCFQQARHYLEKLLKTTRTPGDYLRQLYCVLAEMAWREGKLQESLDTLDRALLIFPTDDNLLYLRAECLYDLNRYPEARETLLRILHAPPASLYRGGVPGDIRELRAPRKLADICRLEGNYEQAEWLLKSLVARFPMDTMSWHFLGRVYLDKRDPVSLSAVVEQLRACPQGEVFGMMLVATWHLHARQVETAEQAIDTLIVLAPLMPMPRILRVELLLQKGVPVGEQIQAIRDLLRVQPRNAQARRLIANLEATQIKTAEVPLELISTFTAVETQLPA